MPNESRVVRAAGALAVFGASLGVFWRTAYPTITWWDSSSYSLAAATLGITSSPGSLMLTLLGWIATRLPTGLTTARMLSLFAGVLGATAVTLVYLGALRLGRIAADASTDSPPTVVGAALGALVLAFSRTLWEYATQFTPYILTVVFTGLILLVMLRWWDAADGEDSWRWLALLAFLFGLDFSVHRTNALLLPAVLGWILVRRPATLARPVSWLAGGAGLLAGLTLHLAVMPISANTDSPLNMFEPSTWTRFWDYVSLAQVGGGFLVELWPRKAGFASVQVMDFLRALRDNFFPWPSPAYVLGCLPSIAAVIGLVTLWRRNGRLGAAVTIVVALHAIMTVLYFNIPASYFRSLNRHYLPVFVTMAIPVGFGMSVIAGWIAHRTRLAAAVTGTIIVLAPVAQLVSNWSANDASRRFFTRDYAVSALEQLPPNAIYFTVGDNDTFPVMYVQAVEGVRRDVTIVNTSLANTTWYVDQIARRDSSFPVKAPTVSRSDSAAADSVRLPVPGWREALGVAREVALPETLTVLPKPMFGGTRMLPADWVLLDVVVKNGWRRPLTVAITAGHENLGWLQSYARLDGLFWRIVPVEKPPVDGDVLHANLVGRPAYRGYADSTVRLEDVTRIMGSQVYVAARTLFDAGGDAAGIVRCREAAAALTAKIPLARLELPADALAELEPRCGPR